jgi:hypothetical protein
MIVPSLLNIASSVPTVLAGGVLPKDPAAKDQLARIFNKTLGQPIQDSNAGAQGALRCCNR